MSRQKEIDGGTPDLDSYISIVIEGANITVEPAYEAIKLTARLVNDDDFVTFKHRPREKGLDDPSIRSGYLNKITGEVAIEIAMPGSQPTLTFDGICSRIQKWKRT